MKLANVEIGGRYTAKVSGKIQVVRVVEFREAYSFGRWRTVIVCRNERTGREVVVRSPQRLRTKVGNA